MADMDNWLLAIGSAQSYANSVISGIGDVQINSTHDGLIFTNKLDGNTFEVILPGFHTHSNLSTILEKFTKDSNGNILYNGNTIITKDNLKAGSNIKIVEGADGKFTISSTGGGGSLERAITSSVNAGAITIGQSFPIGTDNTTMWEKLLVQDLAPKITITSTESDTLIYEKGVAISPTITIKIVKQKTTDGDINKYTLTSTPNDTTFNETNTSPNATTNTIVKNVTIKDNQVYTVNATNTKNKTANSKLTYKFVNPIYIGVLPETIDETTITETDIKTGTKMLKEKVAFQENFTANREKYFICYDSDYGALTSIKDVKNGIEILSGSASFTIDVTLTDGTTKEYIGYISKLRGTYTDSPIKFTW